MTYPTNEQCFNASRAIPLLMRTRGLGYHMKMKLRRMKRRIDERLEDVVSELDELNEQFGEKGEDGKLVWLNANMSLPKVPAAKQDDYDEKRKALLGVEWDDADDPAPVIKATELDKPDSENYEGPDGEALLLMGDFLVDDLDEEPEAVKKAEEKRQKRTAKRAAQNGAEHLEPEAVA